MTLFPLNQTLRTTLLGVLLALAGTPLLADPAEARITAPAGAITVATNQAVTFTATSTDSVGRDGYTVNSFAWSFGDGTTGAGPGTTHAYTNPGTYTATLTVSYTARICKRMDYEGNCLSYLATNYTATATRTLTVLAPPSISNFTASAVSVGVGKPVTLTWATANATSLTLSGQGAVTGTSRTVYPTAPTTYTLTASNPVRSVSATVSVTTYTVGVSLSPGSVSLRLGESRTFTAAVAPANQGVSWSASGGTLGGSTPTGTVYTATSSGSYRVVATSAEDPSKSASATVSVATVSVATPVPSPASAQTYIGGTVAFSALVSGAVDTGVTWAANGGGTFTAPGVFRASARGDWTITATSKADPTRSAATLVHVLPVVVTVNPSHATVRSGQTQLFTASVTGPGTPSQAVTWQVVSSNGGTITTSGIYTAPGNPGDYTLRAISNQDSAAIATATVHVPGWALKWRKDIIYVGTREIAEVDGHGLHVTLVDHLGSPRFQVGPTGTLEITQKYLPFGEPLADPDTTATFAKGFTNHEQTDPSGLIYMQARFYAPWYGRFLSPDPARDQHFEETQSWNIYSYVQNNPIMAIDPNGEELVAIQLANAKSVSVNSGTRGHVIVVDRSMVPKVAALVSGAEASGTRLNITSSFRTNEEQSGLNGSNAVTPAAAGSSPHNAGLGLDGTDGKSKSLPDSVVDQAEDLGMRWGGNFKKADDVHVDGVVSNDQKAKLTKENQAQWRNGTIQGMTLDAKTGKLVPANISNAAMKRNTGQTGAAGRVPTAASTPSKPGWVSRAVDWIKKKLN